jgi:hypothetical protein
VTAETQRYLELLEQRIALLSSLAESLSAASTGLVSFDLDSLESRIAEQERLCTDIGALDGQIDRVQRQCAAHLATAHNQDSRTAPDPDTRRLRETAGRLSKVQSTVKQLNDAHQILLRRSRRTVGALLNSYHSFAMTYSDPSAVRVTAGERL